MMPSHTQHTVPLLGRFTRHIQPVQTVLRQGVVDQQPTCHCLSYPVVIVTQFGKHTRIPGTIPSHTSGTTPDIIHPINRNLCRHARHEK